MRQKRSKTYRKLLSSYILHFGFRPPFQVLIDASFAQTLSALHLSPQEALARLSDVLQVSQLSKGKVNKQNNAFNRGGGYGGREGEGVSGNDEIKLLVTQCSMVELYRDEKLGDLQRDAVQLAKNWERRKCNHREAIPSDQCLAEVIGPANRHRYIVASDSQGLRRELREKVAGVPVVHSNSSRVVVLEKMSERTQERIKEIEAAKYSTTTTSSAPTASNIVSALPSSSSSPDADPSSSTSKSGIIRGGAGGASNRPKAPNPLSNKKPKKVLEEEKREKLKRTREIQERTEANRLMKRRRMEEQQQQGEKGEGGKEERLPPQQQQQEKEERPAAAAAVAALDEKKANGSKAGTPARPKGQTQAKAPAPERDGGEDGPAKKKRKRGGRGGASKAAAAAPTTDTEAVASST